MARIVAANIKDRALVRDRRRQLVRAALRVFIRKGYHRATVRDIGREAGFTQGTIYNYVRSKEDILYLVYDEKVRAHQEAVGRAVRGIADPVHRLSAAIHAIVTAMRAHQDTILLVYRESHALDRRALHAILGRVAEFIEMFEGILADAVRSRRVGVGNHRLAANIVTFLPIIVAMRRWDLRRRVARAVVDRELCAFLLKGLGVVGLPGNGRARAGAEALGAWRFSQDAPAHGNGVPGVLPRHAKAGDAAERRARPLAQPARLGHGVGGAKRHGAAGRRADGEGERQMVGPTRRASVSRRRAGVLSNELVRDGSAPRRRRAASGAGADLRG